MKMIGQDKIVNSFNRLIVDLLSGKGGIIAISGETGMGKSFMLENLYSSTENHKELKSVLVENQAPIRDFKVGNIQPLMPFTKAVREMFDKSGSAQKKLAINIGMTTLASLPLIGDVFYAVKEYGRDWRQYKREKSSESSKKMNSTVADFYDTLISYSDKEPLLLMFDDMHFADELSIELIETLSEKIIDYPIGIVFSYQPSLIEANLHLFIEKAANTDEKQCIRIEELVPLTKEQIREYCKAGIQNYYANSEFEDWLYLKSHGIPGILSGYITHFNKYSPFNENGTLKDSFDNSSAFPENVNNVIANTMEELTEEDINLLAVCAAEGFEFSAYLIAYLLNTDVITAIKRLRRIQLNHFIIKSTGAKMKYGVKTTMYEFSQTYYHKYFENVLEYEEKLSIHGQIAAFLKTKFDETANKGLRNELAPYIAAHSMVSGDEKTAKEMLVQSAKAANEVESKEIIKKAYEVYQNISTDKTDDTENPDNIIFKELLDRSLLQVPAIEIGKDGSENSNENSANYPIDFNYVRRAVVDEYHKGNLSKSIEVADTYINSHGETLKPSESAQLLSIISRSYLALDDIENASLYIEKAADLLKDYKEPVPESFVLNVSAIIDMKNGDNETAYLKLQKAAKKSINLPPEIRLITLSNIAILLRSIDDKKAEKYLSAVRRMAKQMNYDELAFDVFR